MAKEQHIINGIKIKNPTSFQVERYPITNLERIANADMAGDLIARKQKFLYRYDSIDQRDWDDILRAIWEGSSIFVTLQVQEGNKFNTYQVYPGSINADRYRDGGEWVWKDASFNLIQQ